MLKATSTVSGVVTVLGILQLFVAGLVGAYAYPRGDKGINLKRQFPDERTNLTVSTPIPSKTSLTNHTYFLCKFLPSFIPLPPSHAS